MAARRFLPILALLLAASIGAQGADQARRDPGSYESYRQVVLATAGMVGDGHARDLVRRHGLDLLDLTWEDTGRAKMSAVGPNISDMTIQVQLMDPLTERFSLHLMPVIRYPNFADRSCDVPLDRLHVLVGNERNGSLRRVSLREVLSDVPSFLSDPSSWRARERSLLKRPFLWGRGDSHVLVSAQACFLPVPRTGQAEFNPVLFNYQSVKGDPAVLTILATREGTSITIIDNVRDAFQAGATWGQRLFFNAGGQRASLTGTRLSDMVEAARNQGHGLDPVAPLAPESGLNLVLLIQVPLKQRQPERRGWAMEDSLGAPAPAAEASKARDRSDVEEAVIGHGRIEGPFTEIDGLEIERDDRFPIRATVQLYQATSNGVVDERDIANLARQIERIYRDADYVGSLVVEGQTGRPTEHHGDQTVRPDWWHKFWIDYEASTHISREDALAMLRRLRGATWEPASLAELEAAVRDMQGK